MIVSMYITAFASISSIRLSNRGPFVGCQSIQKGNFVNTRPSLWKLKAVDLILGKRMNYVEDQVLI